MEAQPIDKAEVRAGKRILASGCFDLPESGGKRLLALGADDCRWPLGEPGQVRYCGADKGRHRSYCREHRALAYRVPA